MSYCGEGEREARKEGGKRSENVHCGFARSWVFLGLPSLSPHRLPVPHVDLLETCSFTGTPGDSGLAHGGTPFVTLLMEHSFDLTPGAHLNLLHPSVWGGRQRVRWAWWQRWWMVGEGGKGHVVGTCLALSCGLEKEPQQLAPQHTPKPGWFQSSEVGPGA